MIGGDAKNNNKQMLRRLPDQHDTCVLSMTASLLQTDLRIGTQSAFFRIVGLNNGNGRIKQFL